jgi:cytochrome c-type biogenesis protein CcmH
MFLSLLFTLLVLTALLPLVVPMLRRAETVPERGYFNRKVYRDQLRELDRDVARGLLSETDIAEARLEIQRRLLATDTAPVVRLPGWPDRSPPDRSPPDRSPVVAAIVAMFVAGGTVGLYAWLGAPKPPGVVFVSRPTLAGDIPAPVLERSDLVRTAARLAEKLQADPSNAERWVLYARTSGSLRRWNVAVDAYRHALALNLCSPDVQNGLGEMLVMQAGGIVTPAAHNAFTAALKDDPKNEVARYYLALAAGQAGQPDETIRQMQGLLADIPDDSPMRDEIARRIADAAKAAGVPMPALARGLPADVEPDSDAPDAVAVLPEGEQRAMVAGMVAKLATRLEAEPDDIDGWMRLGHGYMAMHKADKAAAAYDHALALKPGSVAIRLQAIEGLLTGLKPADTLPPQAIALLKQIEAVAPDEPEVLWYLGMVAAHDAHPEEARRYWSRLLAKLPADGENTRIVKAALGSLPGG